MNYTAKRGSMSTAKLGNMRKSFGVKLRELRGAQSQAAVAAVFGIAQQTYAGWEKDQRKPDLTELCSICSHYSVTADWLLGLSPASSETILHSKMSDSAELYIDACKECKKKDGQIERLERIIDKLTK